MQSDRVSVKSRLRKEASVVWGIPEGQLDGFDPVLDLLLGACAVEFEKTAQDLAASEARILQRLIRLVMPETVTGTQPAHAVLHARAYEPVQEVKPEDPFFCLHNGEEVFFSPASTLPVVDGAVRLLAAGDTLCRCAGPLQKEQCLEAHPGSRLPPSVLWIGLALDTAGADLGDLTFFFNWKTRSEQEKTFYYRLLAACRWYVRGEPVVVRPGLPVPAGTQPASPGVLDSPGVLEELDLTGKIERHVLSVYRQAFLRLETRPRQPLRRQTYQEAFPGVFPAADSGELGEELIWLEVHFPEYFPAGALDEVYCAINCFPVINRRLNQENYRLQQHFNIVPLAGDQESFLDVKGIVAGNGNEYRPTPLENQPAGLSRTFNVRRGGVHKFDRRDASQMLAHVLSLLRDESAAFAALGLDTGEITQLNQIVARLNRSLEGFPAVQETMPYVFIHGQAEVEDVTITYWTTRGGAANQVPAGTKLYLYGSVLLRDESLVLVGASYGGRDALNEAESLHAYRKALLTRDRVVTAEDIRAVCFAELGSNLASVEVKPGIMLQPSLKKGFVRSIDVRIAPAPKSKLTRGDWQKLAVDLQETLQSRSSSVCPIQVMVTN